MSNNIKEPAKDELINETAKYLSAYIGEIEGVKSVGENIEPALNVNGITDLLEYHFLRTGGLNDDPSSSEIMFNYNGKISDGPDSVGVLDFIGGLPKKVRSIDPAIRLEEQVIKGAIEGRIERNQTQKHRRATSADASRDFVCRIPDHGHSSPQNKILFKLLTSIREVYKKYDECISEESGNRPGWFQQWKPGARARENVENALSSVYFDSFDANSISISDRDIREVADGGRTLYQEAAGLLAGYRRLVDEELDEEFARSLLRSDIFKPKEDDDSLYELYWIFKIIETFSESRLEYIRDSNRGRLVAQWTDENYEYMFFNDWNGIYTPAPGEQKQYLLEFAPPEYNFGGEIDSKAEDSTLRRASILRYSQQIRQQGLSYTPSRQYPDIVILKNNLDDGDLEKLFIGEVKHSVDKGYLRDNSQQIIEYGMFARTGEDLNLAVRDSGSGFITSGSNIGSDSRIEIGYFVGHSDTISEIDDDCVNLYGFNDEPDFDFLG